MNLRAFLLVRDRVAMEEARNLDAITFDKTGTLTEGEQGTADVDASSSDSGSYSYSTPRSLAASPRW